jgi:hypothetical protein
MIDSADASGLRESGAALPSLGRSTNLPGRGYWVDRLGQVLRGGVFD